MPAPASSPGRAGGRPCCQAFPSDYPAAIAGAQAAVRAALADGHELLEVEFPSASLASVSGDAEGANEMTYSLGYLRSFCRIFQDQAASTRIFFPDEQEMRLAAGRTSRTGGKTGKTDDAVFGQTAFQLDFLTRPSFLHDIGLGALDRVDVAAKVRPSDRLFVCAYPHFNVGEIVAIKEAWDGAVQGTGRPLLIFNGELDRLRSGYYPPLFYPGLARMAREWLPNFCSAFYLKNFKSSSRPGVLFREYPGPWQVFRREGPQRDQLRLIAERESMPSLKEVAMEILPSNL